MIRIVLLVLFVFWGGVLTLIDEEMLSITSSSKLRANYHNYTEENQYGGDSTILTANTTATFGCDNTRISVVNMPLKKGHTYFFTITSASIVSGTSIKIVTISSQTPTIPSLYRFAKYVGESFFFTAIQDTDDIKVYMELNSNGIDPTGSSISVRIDCLDNNTKPSNNTIKKSHHSSIHQYDFETIKSQLVNKNVYDKCAKLYYNLQNLSQNEKKFLFGQWRSSSMALGKDGAQIDYRKTNLTDGGTVLATWDDKRKRAGVRRLPTIFDGILYNNLDNIGKFSNKPCGTTEEDLGWSVLYDYNNLIKDSKSNYIKGTQLERYNCVSAIINYWEAHNRNALVNLVAHIGNPLKEIEAPDLDMGGQDYRYISPNHVHLLKDIFEGNAVWRDTITLKQWWDEILSQLCDCIDLLIDANGDKIPVTLRLFHEFDCPYFWWGFNYNTGDEYIELWRYSVDYIKNRCDNVLFTWCAEHHWSDAESDIILDRYYPGDEYVDIIACDCYDPMFTRRDEPYKMLKRITAFAHNHGKVLALTETGFTSDGEGLARAKESQAKIDDGIYDRLLDNIVISDFKPAYVMVYGAYRIPNKKSSNFNNFMKKTRITNINEVLLYEF